MKYWEYDVMMGWDGFRKFGDMGFILGISSYYIILYYIVKLLLRFTCLYFSVH